MAIRWGQEQTRAWSQAAPEIHPNQERTISPELVVRDVIVARLENATPMKSQPVRSLVRVEDWGLIHVGFFAAQLCWHEIHLEPCTFQLG